MGLSTNRRPPHVACSAATWHSLRPSLPRIVDKDDFTEANMIVARIGAMGTGKLIKILRIEGPHRMIVVRRQSVCFCVCDIWCGKGSEVREILARSYGGRNRRRGGGDDNNNRRCPTDHKRRKPCTVTPFCFWVSMISFTKLTFQGFGLLFRGSNARTLRFHG